MARVRYIEPAEATGAAKEIYEKKLKGKPINLQKALAHRPGILDAFIGFYGSIGQSLDKRLYEMVYIRVSMVNGCNY